VVLGQAKGLDGEADLAAVEALLDDGFLTEVGWEAERLVLVAPPDHGLMLFRVGGCRTRGRRPADAACHLSRSARLWD
jgi:hypothetical protein